VFKHPISPDHHERLIFVMATQFKSCSVINCNGNAHRDGRGSLGLCRKHRERLRRRGTTDPNPEIRKCQVWLHKHASHTGDDCLIWAFARNHMGYGHVDFSGVHMTAHRAMCILVHGEPVGEDMHAAHSCRGGYDGCVNPTHLRWDTRAGNFADKLIDGTDNRGEKHGCAKITQSDVLEIRALRGKMTQRDIAEIFEISPAYVCALQARRTWDWLE
jgi:hypothetical protein